MNTISIPRLRNLTTGILHTKMDDIYADIEAFTGMDGITTHQLPSASAALQPHLRKHYKDQPVWDDGFNPNIGGNVPLISYPAG